MAMGRSFDESHREKKSWWRQRALFQGVRTSSRGEKTARDSSSSLLVNAEFLK